MTAPADKSAATGPAASAKAAGIPTITLAVEAGPGSPDDALPATSLAAVVRELTEERPAPAHPAAKVVRVVVFDGRTARPETSAEASAAKLAAAISAAIPASVPAPKVEVVDVRGLGVGERLRRLLHTTGADGRHRPLRPDEPGEWVLRMPATGVETAWLRRLADRPAEALVVAPDIVVAARPEASRGNGGWGARLSRRVHEWCLRLVFGIPATDPASPVMLLRVGAAWEAVPQSGGAFAPREFLARANFVGRLIDELPMRGAWTGGAADEPVWSEIRREARRVMAEPAFPVRHGRAAVASDGGAAAGGTAGPAGGGGAGSPDRADRADRSDRKSKSGKRGRRGGAK